MPSRLARAYKHARVFSFAAEGRVPPAPRGLAGFAAFVFQILLLPLSWPSLPPVTCHLPHYHSLASQKQRALAFAHKSPVNSRSAKCIMSNAFDFFHHRTLPTAAVCRQPCAIYLCTCLPVSLFPRFPVPLPLVTCHMRFIFPIFSIYPI